MMANLQKQQAKDDKAHDKFMRKEMKKLKKIMKEKKKLDKGLKKKH